MLSSLPQTSQRWHAFSGSGNSSRFACATSLARADDSRLLAAAAAAAALPAELPRPALLPLLPEAEGDNEARRWC